MIIDLILSHRANGPGRSRNLALTSTKADLRRLTSFEK
ncbi:hypothetical protein AVEN_42163-1, partial [Araneus ventricosus]